MTRMKEKDNTGDEIENASLLIRELLQNNDPLIQKMINGFVEKRWPYTRIFGKEYEPGEKEYIIKELQNREIKRQQFYRDFRENCQDGALQKEFFKALEKFMERKT
ncbi:MAG: hypothetical protein A2Y65_03510 [Deltaproteobacteria bacterium RBG_13_52_11]|nr:MAG: hypothetical protein A2Y65_03510 [Deltaproteobacteria bacterium RBG_13_52_11]